MLQKALDTTFGIFFANLSLSRFLVELGSYVTRSIEKRAL